MPDVIPDIDAIPDQPQEMYFIKRSLRMLQDRLTLLEQVQAQPKTEGELRAAIAKLEARVGVLERVPTPATVILPAEGCRVYNSATIALAHDSEVTLTFDTERYDTDDMHSTVSNTGRITFNTAGKYQVGGSVQISNTDADAMWAWGAVRLNGSTYIVEFAAASDRAGVGFNARVNPNCVYHFAVGDYIELRVRQNNFDGDAEIAAVSANTSPEFWAQRLAD